MVFAESASGSLQTKEEYPESKNHLGNIIMNLVSLHPLFGGQDTASKNMNDPIGDFLIRIKNAGNAGRSSVSVPFSKMKFAIAEILSNKGFVGAVSKKSKGETLKFLNIALLYETDGSPKIRDVKRVSKPSKRIYEKAKNIKKFRGGFGIHVLSTPKGVLADVDARKANLGGEVLFDIW